MQSLRPRPPRGPARLARSAAVVCAPLVATMAMVLTGPSALAAAPIMAQGGGCSGAIGWTNANQSVSVGDSVTWSNCASGFHQLQSTSSGWCLANNQTAGQTGTAWSYTCKFAASGTYTYQCSVHTTQMAGTITVTAAPPPPPPPPAASPPPSPAHSAPPLPPAGTHASPAPAAAATAPSPSPSPSDSSQALVGPSDSGTPGAGVLGLASKPPSSSGGFPTGPFILGLVVLLGGGAAAVYFLRIRRPDTRDPDQDAS
jgi:plastocyanin